MSDMYFDVSSFDFDSLTDIVSLDENGNAQPDPSANTGVVDDISDLIDPSEREQEVEEGEGEEVEETEEGEETEEVAEEPEEEEVDFEDYQITLPTGEDVTLSELVKGYRDNSQLEEAVNQFNQDREAFIEQSNSIGKLLDLAKLEADRTIEDYKGFDWNRYKAEDPAGYVENREYLDRFIERRKEIVSAMEEREAALARDQAAAKEAAAIEAGQILSRDIPGWNKNLYEELMEYAIANGAEKESILNSTDPVMFKMLYKALQFEKGKQVVTAKVKRIGSTPTKVVKPGAKPAPTEVDNTKVKATISKMGTSRKANLDAFAFLKD